MQPDDFSQVDIEQLRQNRQWQSQYRLLIEWGQLIQTKPDLRIPDNKINGCATDAWLDYDGGNFYFDSDSRIINGLAALFLSQAKRSLRQADSLKSDDRIRIDVSQWEKILEELGLQRHLSPSRSNGFRALVRRAQVLVRQKRTPR